MLMTSGRTAKVMPNAPPRLWRGVSRPPFSAGCSRRGAAARVASLVGEAGAGRRQPGCNGPRVFRKAGLALGWLWLAVGVVVLAAALFSASSPPPVTTAPPAAVATSGVRDLGGAVQPFLDFAAESAQPGGDGLPKMALDHRYTAEGLRRLGAALAALYGPSSHAAATARTAAEAITRNPRSLQHADEVHAAFAAAAAALDRVSPGGHLDQFAAAVEPSRPLLSQQRQVRDFFIAAGRHVRAAAGQTP